MARLCSESSRSYPGRSAPQAACAARGVGLRPRSKGREVPPNPTVAVIATGAGLRPTSKGVDWPPDPTEIQAARIAVTHGVMGQKSAEAIVAQRLSVMGRTW